jgi:hypothetical protein
MLEVGLFGGGGGAACACLRSEFPCHWQNRRRRRVRRSRMDNACSQSLASAAISRYGCKRTLPRCLPGCYRDVAEFVSRLFQLEFSFASQIKGALNRRKTNLSRRLPSHGIGRLLANTGRGVCQHFSHNWKKNLYSAHRMESAADECLHLDHLLARRHHFSDVRRSDDASAARLCLEKCRSSVRHFPVDVLCASTIDLAPAAFCLPHLVSSPRGFQTAAPERVPASSALRVDYFFSRYDGVNCFDAVKRPKLRWWTRLTMQDARGGS